MTNRLAIPLALVLTLGLRLSPTLTVHADGAAPQARRGPGDRLIPGLRLLPHWVTPTQFWYRHDGREGAREFLWVDAETGSKRPAFDHPRLAAALSAVEGGHDPADRLPFDEITPQPNGQSLRVRVRGVTWRCDLHSYALSKCEGVDALPDPGPNRDDPRRPRRRRNDGDADGAPRGEARSADGRWTAFLRDHNVYLKSESHDELVPLSDDGREGLEYGLLSWSPDSQTLLAFRIEPGENLPVHLIRSSPPGGGRARLESRPYPLPGDRLDAFEPVLFRVADRKPIRPEVDRIDLDDPRPRWSRDGSRFTYTKVDRGHQRLRLVEVEAQSGHARNLIDERSETFLWTAHTEEFDLRPIQWLDKTDEILYVSERTGWRHLYRVDAKSGAMEPITQGEYVVRGIDHVDEDARQIWFHASGRNPGEDPYFLHYYRVNFDGTGLLALTEGNGDHHVQFSPDQAYLLDTYSRVDLGPVHDLRRAADGSLVRHLEAADLTDLKASGWQTPEPFVSKGRDGKSDIWGIIRRPRGFDPSRKYPVIEEIYAGPQGSSVPKAFSPWAGASPLTDLGFVVVQIDGMGTANRSKAFHDVCWHNLKDAGFPDRILWHRAVAAKYPWYDLARMGITGVSAGGQNATGGVLFHPDFYKVAVSGCGCHDNRMDKASWNEQWMGYPVGPWYSESSNIDNAARLQGKLLLIVGEMDDNVPPESTLRLADALIRADKDFELLVVPNAGHGIGGAYGARKQREFFVKHLKPDTPVAADSGGAPKPANSAIP